MSLGAENLTLDEDLLDFQNVLVALIRSLVDRPGDVEILPVVSEERITFSVRTHAADLGKLVGNQGRTARALRVIVRANAAKLGRKIDLDLGRL